MWVRRAAQRGEPGALQGPKGRTVGSGQGADGRRPGADMKNHSLLCDLSYSSIASRVVIQSLLNFTAGNCPFRANKDKYSSE